jgi:DNA-directed RNA polymerase subunit K/omega
MPPKLAKKKKQQTIEPVAENKQIIPNKYEIDRELFFMRPENRITSEFITKYEFARVVSIRAKQIERDNLVFTTIPPNITDPIAMAVQEIRDKKCPLSVVRKIGLNLAEKWDVNEMAVRF